MELPLGAPIDDYRAVMLVAVPGNIDLDGEVGPADMAAFEEAFDRLTGSWEDGDFTYNGFVDFRGYLLIKQNYGVALAPPPAAAAEALFEGPAGPDTAAAETPPEMTATEGVLFPIPPVLPPAGPLTPGALAESGTDFAPAATSPRPSAAGVGPMAVTLALPARPRRSVPDAAPTMTAGAGESPRPSMPKRIDVSELLSVDVLARALAIDMPSLTGVYFPA